MISAHAKGFLCRDCLLSGHYGFAAEKATMPRPVCPSCDSGRVVLHDELFSLAMAHIDCDAFYCSVEKRDNPELRDKPVIVGAVIVAWSLRPVMWRAGLASVLPCPHGRPEKLVLN